MPLLQCYRLNHAVGTRSLFRDIDLTVNDNDRIGLVGHNGSGKSTLLSILNGALEPDSGDISRNRSLHLETVEQFISPDLIEMTLIDALAAKLPAEEAAAGLYQAEQLLDQLGFTLDEHQHKVGDLSGGQQNRLMFARAVITAPNLILFDEPTNHLDLKSLLIFEKFLHQARCAYLIISHDRAFLDSVTNRTLILRDERLYAFDLPFSKAREALTAQDEAAAASRAQEEKTIQRLEASAQRLATWGKVYDNEKLARKAKTIEKRVEKLKDDQTFVSKGSGLKLTLEVDSAQANRMLQIEHCNVNAPDGTTLFHIEDLQIRPGERFALLGHNGAGKTTLINFIMQTWQSGTLLDEIRFNPRCDIGYYDQELEQLDPSLSMIETLCARCDGSESDLKSALIRAGFPYLDLDKKVAVLSGGEKARLMFLIIHLRSPNFLVLDEPTNHIDIEGKEDLESQILATNATVLITSHDRRFVDNIADRYLLISNGTLRDILDPREFYRADETPVTASRMAERSSVSAPTQEDEILARIVELETLLEADRARKPKFQKENLQRAWQEELDILNEKLEDS